MELPSWAMAGIRTAVQAGVGFVIAWLASKGFTVDAVALEGVVFAVITGFAAAGLRLIERHAPWLTRVMSLGLSSRKPVYVEPPTSVAVA